MIAYRATLDVLRELAWFVAKLLLAERWRRGTPKGSRVLSCFWQAVLGLRWFRDRKIIPADRCREKTVSVQGDLIDVWYSGKAHTHGGIIQAVLAPDGFPLWVSEVEPGSVHDLTAACIHALPGLYWAAAIGLPALADPGYVGAGIGVHIPVKQPADGRDLDIGTAPATHCSARCAASSNAGLRWSPASGAPSSTSPLAPARLATSPAPRSSLPISSTTTSNEIAEITSMIEEPVHQPLIGLGDGVFEEQSLGR